jgi:MFS family permease
VLRLLRNRDLVLLISGQAVSQMGDGIFMIAIAWRVFQTYNSPGALSVVGIAYIVPRVVVTLAGGILSDRFERRWTMIFADLGRAIPIALLAVISLGPDKELAVIVALVAIQAVAGALFHPAESALLPQLVEPDDLAAANSLRTIVHPLSFTVAGSALGGALTAAFGTSTAFLVDAGTFCVSVLTLLLMKPHPMAKTSAGTSVLADAREGFAYVAGRPWLWGPIVAASLGQLLYAGPSQALVPYLVKYELHASAAALGLVFAAGGMGTITAALLVGRLSRPRHIVTWMVLGWAGGIASLAGVGLAQTVWQAALAMFVWSLLLWSAEILWLTLLGFTVPNEIRGRVASIDFVGSFWLIPISMALTGPAAAALGSRTLLIGAGLAGGVAILLTLLVPGVTRPKFLAAARTPEAVPLPR